MVQDVRKSWILRLLLWFLFSAGDFCWWFLSVVLLCVLAGLSCFLSGLVVVSVWGFFFLVLVC